MKLLPAAPPDSQSQWPDPALCEQEPIHIPGAIQPHGAILAASADTLRITHASANLAAILGRPPEAVLGLPLADIIGPIAAGTTADPRPEPGAAGKHPDTLRAPDGGMLHLAVHWAAHRIVVDIEPRRREAWQHPPITAAQAVLESFNQAAGPNDLCELAVRGLRAITGYDRVLAYRFGPDGHGEVIAEARAAETESYLGLHYPAADIPAQARRQYLKQRVGAIVDATYQPVPLCVDPALDDGIPLDLTHSALRSASPLHREYMRNMGLRASLTVGLAHGTELWGLLVCHHPTPRIAGPDLRALAGMIGQVLSLLLVSLGEAELQTKRNHRHAALRAMVDRLAAPAPLAEILAGSETELLDLVDATGAVVSFDNTLHCLGRTPPRALAERAFATLLLEARGRILAIEDLGQCYPALAACTDVSSGALLLPLTQGTDDAILWLRPSVSRTITWGGNPAEHATIASGTGRVAPRTSFARWTETISVRSAPWTDADLTVAREFRISLEAQVAQRTRAELDRLRQFDAVAGQPNRQRDLERSNSDLEEFAYAASHDLKAPLRAIGHLAQWIGEDIGPTASAETTENLRLLEGRVARLQRLLDGLLAYSRVVRLTAAEAEPIDVGELVREIATFLAPPPGFVIAYVGEAKPIHTQRILLDVVLKNLIGNAVKHHDRAVGHVTVGMRLADGVAEFRVTDDGPGIPQRFHDRIFLIFQTLESRDDREASGIGLAIVKRRVLANGGLIWVESAPPARGTTIVFTWNETVS